MIEQQAKVVETDDNTVWLEAERQSTCSSCQVRKGCGTGMLAEHVGKRLSRISVDKTKDVEVGQNVQLTIPEDALLSGAFLMYILPLVFMFLAAALAQALNFNELVEIIFAFSGLLGGFYWVRRKLRTQSNSLKAKIVEE